MAENPQHAQHDDPVIALFGNAFKTPSVGTEQELGGVRIGLKAFTDRLIGTVNKAEQTLVAITTDMTRDKVGEYQTYTLELVTTPTEAADLSGWVDRIEALELLVPEIEKAAKAQGPLTGQPLGPYTMTIRQAGHVILPEATASGGVSGSSRQGTLCVPISWLLRDFLVEASNAKPAVGGPPVLQVPPGFPMPIWFDPNATARAPLTDPAARQVYALVESAILEFVRILRRFPTAVAKIREALAHQGAALKKQQQFARQASGVDGKDVEIAELYAKKALLEAQVAMRSLVLSPGWKDAWKVLPRTGLTAVLAALGDQLEQAVRDAITRFRLDDLRQELSPDEQYRRAMADEPIDIPTGFTDEDTPLLLWARHHILNGLSLGGHFFADQLIGGEPGFLVEFREHRPLCFLDKFYYPHGESEIYQHKPAKERRRLVLEWTK